MAVQFTKLSVSPEVVQTTGTSETAVMSQKAVTDALASAGGGGSSGGGLTLTHIITGTPTKSSSSMTINVDTTVYKGFLVSCWLNNGEYLHCQWLLLKPLANKTTSGIMWMDRSYPASSTGYAPYAIALERYALSYTASNLSFYLQNGTKMTDTENTEITTTSYTFEIAGVS